VAQLYSKYLCGSSHIISLTVHGRWIHSPETYQTRGYTWQG